MLVRLLLDLCHDSASLSAQPAFSPFSHSCQPQGTSNKPCRLTPSQGLLPKEPSLGSVPAGLGVREAPFYSVSCAPPPPPLHCERADSGALLCPFKCPVPGSVSEHSRHSVGDGWDVNECARTRGRHHSVRGVEGFLKTSQLRRLL